MRDWSAAPEQGAARRPCFDSHTLEGERQPFLFDTIFDGLCVFRFPQLPSFVETVNPGEVLRSPVRIRIPQVYQQPQFRSVWQPAAVAAPAATEL